MRTTEEIILDYAVQRWGKKTLASIGLKLGEECGEVQGAIIKIPEGRADGADLAEEIGDVLIVLSQLAAVSGTTLESLRAIRFADIQFRYATTPCTAPMPSASSATT